MHVTGNGVARVALSLVKWLPGSSAVTALSSSQPHSSLDRFFFCFDCSLWDNSFGVPSSGVPLLISLSGHTASHPPHALVLRLSGTILVRYLNWHFSASLYAAAAGWATYILVVFV